MLDWLRSRLAPPPAPLLPSALPALRDTGGSADYSPPDLRGLSGGRLSLDSSDTYLGTTKVILPPTDAEDAWRLADLDSRTLDKYSPAQLLQLLSDLSPEVSRALWDFLRFCNPGWEATALRPGTEEQDTRAQATLDAFLGTLHDYYGTVDVVIGRLFMSAFLRGAFMAELVLDERGRLPLDLATPDPDSARFQRTLDPVRGSVYTLGQWQIGGFVALDRPTIRYIPVDPFPGSPYGRPMASPALYTSLFLIGLLHDLRRVVSQQGYPRIDVSMDLQRLKDTMPAQAAQDPKVFMEWANALFKEIQTTYQNLQPDDAYVHSDVVQVGRAVGTLDSNSLSAVDGLIKGLERMSTRALKSTPLMFGTTEGTSEANSNRQYELYVQGIKSVQHLAETLLERLMTIALQVQGIAATVQWRFAENRASEMLRDQQTAALTIDNAFKKWAYGWASMDEVSQEVTGHPADAADKMPRVLFKGETEPGVAQAATAQADPGSNRTIPLRVVGDGP